ncbi:glycosyltransferase involved in cell wall biosynthesis [Antricoccus suffuscus]|uniref:Glycosyltransferase involved in cell wall biosynthesis n=1 Tax=Antricoccus suffuscus TaxID=1629062 RepID=A0A2T0ZQH9_9ACTN|nr:glycosyltransferase family 1 protein [Antricoccus suffuscus]PRZ38609.1 glycosyltransferase involved in cell wall biosynthesis [Antricoccus suffuscus]
MAHGTARARSVAFLLEQCLAPVPGGTGRYTKEIAAALAAVDRERTVVGWTAAHRDLAPARIRGVRGPKTLPLPRRGLIAAWDTGIGPAPRGADLVHAPTMLVPPRRRKPLVVTIHDAVPWTHPETLTPRGATWHRRVGERVARQADAIVVPSQAVVDQLVEFIDIGAKTSVIGLGVSRDLDLPTDADARAVRLGLPETYLLSVATLEPRKGLDVLLAALANPSAPKVPLLVVGQPGWGGIDLDKEASRLGLPADRVRVMGRLSDADLAVTFARAGVLVAPSRSEGFGIPVLEAMAAGTPVIHSDAPALVEVAGGAGVVVPVGESRLLAEAIRGVIDDHGTQQRLRSLGLRRATDFSWEKSARALWQLYDDVLDNA